MCLAIYYYDLHWMYTLILTYHSCIIQNLTTSRHWRHHEGFFLGDWLWSDIGNVETFIWELKFLISIRCLVSLRSVHFYFLSPSFNFVTARFHSAEIQKIPSPQWQKYGSQIRGYAGHLMWILKFRRSVDKTCKYLTLLLTVLYLTVQGGSFQPRIIMAQWETLK